MEGLCVPLAFVVPAVPKSLQAFSIRGDILYICEWNPQDANETEAISCLREALKSPEKHPKH